MIRPTRFQVAPTTSTKKDGRRKNQTRRKPSAPVTELVVNHHPPDMAGGGYFGMGMAIPYCQEIKSNTSSRKGVDPPDANESRYSRRHSIHASRFGLAPLEDGSYEDDDDASRRRVDSPERTVPTPRQSHTLPPKKNHRNQRIYTNHKVGSVGYLQSQKQHQEQAAYRNQVTNKEQKKSTYCEVDRVTSYQQHPWQKQNKQASTPSSNAAVNNHDVSELSFRGLDPPERHQGRKSTKTNVLGPQDPPAQERSGNMDHHRRLASRRKSSGNRRAGDKKTRSSFTPRKKKGAATLRSSKEGTPRSSGQRTSSSRSSTPRRNHAVPPGKETKKKTKKQETTQIKGILRKKDAPPPTAFFGGQPTSSDSSSSSNTRDGESAGNKTKSASSYESTKKPPNHYLMESGSDDSDDMSTGMESIKSSNSMKSALRRGKFAASGNHNSSSSDEDSLFSMSSTSYSNSTEDEGKSFKFDRTRSHFLRTADLGLTEDTIFAQQFLDDPNSTPEPHYHHPTPRPPPGVQFNIDENWICVDDGSGGHSPIAPQAVDALVTMGFRAVCDPMMWTPTSKTRKYMNEKRLTFGSLPFALPGPIFEGEGVCLLWSGKFRHHRHGSELPVIRSQGFVNKSAEELVDLFMDSSRVEEYNKTSAGRIDEVVLSFGNDTECPFSGQRKKKLTGVVVQGAKIVDGTAFMDDEQSDFEEQRSSSTSSSRRRRKASKFVGVTKIVRSTKKIPLIKKTSEFTTLLHCRELLDEQGGNGYIIVGRSITPADDTERGGKRVIRSEVLLNVTIIRRLHQGEKGIARSVTVSDSGRVATKKDLRNRCLLITMNHVKSPLIPKLIAKTSRLNAAASFMKDIRAA
mmetsp:Transcript_8055/g.14003  ORF Transcript_8055/g.14003 Transcript_8055/m.14003 type:complete len:854 (+) Transcript_8055:458-3019(+)|eukprot:CAMPEP_0201896376 /NCGR_PEP_ID=MMETSP0902-20130614/44477_1 /ASSEMBLY_ACC=CAM_ASM_000551 /TAXON_ID=420261 /ORGANISM="Thalassiosira antarctica, Strain CCMP982" /LENGTH=853 /DNA_ID=CAMNT_0048428949 /DNA_START=396 /DNA_END=2957 /DNA_ORIENTATION=-